MFTFYYTRARPQYEFSILGWLLSDDPSLGPSDIVKVMSSGEDHRATGGLGRDPRWS